MSSLAKKPVHARTGFFVTPSPNSSASHPTFCLPEFSPPAARLFHAAALLEEKWDFGFQALIPKLRDAILHDSYFIILNCLKYNPTMKFDPKIHHRHSIRLKGYDHSRAGVYFVTIVTWQREMLFGEIGDGELVLNEFGEIVREEWERTAIVRSYVKLGEYVIMPNHVHGILVFVDDGVGATRRVAPTKTTLQSGSLGAVMAQFKSIVTKRINGLQNVSGRPIWQRNYYERIIRNEHEMDRITRYIESNPSMWAEDDENPDRVNR